MYPKTSRNNSSYAAKNRSDPKNITFLKSCGKKKKIDLGKIKPRKNFKKKSINLIKKNGKAPTRKLAELKSDIRMKL